jgi:hypothetical protein
MLVVGLSIDSIVSADEAKLLTQNKIDNFIL